MSIDDALARLKASGLTVKVTGVNLASLQAAVTPAATPDAAPRARSWSKRSKVKTSERAFMKTVIAEARLWGWKSAHFRTSRDKSGKHLTAVAGDGKGFPDLVLVRGAVMVYAELKVGRNVPSPDQVDWLDRLAAANRHVYCWYPDDLPFIRQLLEHER